MPRTRSTRDASRFTTTPHMELNAPDHPACGSRAGRFGSAGGFSPQDFDPIISSQAATAPRGPGADLEIPVAINRRRRQRGRRAWERALVVMMMRRPRAVRRRHGVRRTRLLVMMRRVMM